MDVIKEIDRYPFKSLQVEKLDALRMGNAEHLVGLDRVILIDRQSNEPYGVCMEAKVALLQDGIVNTKTVRGKPKWGDSIEHLDCSMNIDCCYKNVLEQLSEMKVITNTLILN